jgi:CheY-like chemotaxis protein
MPKRILLADDSITIQKVVELTFSDGDYEVVAVNNGARAIQKLSEMRPDIILSDIIMPEKNGYEVCEFVKSHPEFRNIPVVLLTGTFEPFDPDRADKAGCDAVVTKPFESQSLIQRVEELIDQARANAASAPAAVAAPEPIAPEPAPWEAPAAPAWEAPAAPSWEAPAAPSWDAPAAPSFAPAQQSGFTSASGSVPAAADPFAGGFATNDNDIFGAAPNPGATTEMPFDAPEPPAPSDYSGETRAFPRMSFDELQQMANAPAAAPEPEPPSAPEPASPWDEPAAPEPAAFGGETRAFPRMSFDDLQSLANAPAAAPEPASPWDEPAAVEPEPIAAEPEPPAFGGETRAFPRMSFEELQSMANAPAAEPEPPAAAAPPAPEPSSPWDEPASEPAAFGGETRAFPRMSFEELQSMAPAPEPASPWDEPAAEAAPLESAPLPDVEPEPEPEPEPLSAAPEPSSPWDEPAQEPQQQEEESPFAAPAAFDEPAASYEEAPAFASVHEPEPEPIAEPEAEPEPAWSPTAAESHPVPSPALIAQAAEGADLTDDQVERIARRVVQLMSEQVVKNIAWEVVPDVAHIAVKERIRELESEA